MSVCLSVSTPVGRLQFITATKNVFVMLGIIMTSWWCVVQASCGADWLSTTEQPAGVLVHGRLCPTELPRHEDRVL